MIASWGRGPGAPGCRSIALRPPQGSSASRGRINFIFHTGHVGSTLVSRLLDETGPVLSVREPLPLRTLAEAQDTLRAPESLLGEPRFELLLDTLMRLWSRGYPATPQRRRQGDEQRVATGARGSAAVRSDACGLPAPPRRTCAGHAAGRGELRYRPARAWRRAAEAAACAPRYRDRAAIRAVAR